MKLIRLDQQLKCIFCQKSQQGVKKLIASPDHHTYICDDCTVERGRLRLGSDNALTVSFRCSFCRSDNVSSVFMFLA
jgi:ClpX C4-type zinc finger